ncbi:hypothetical protein Tco_0798703 [Tanacetum coccineum]
MSFSKRPGKNTPQCYTKPLDSLKNWNNRFFWVDERIFPTVVEWCTNSPKDKMPSADSYSAAHIMALNTHRTPIANTTEALYASRLSFMLLFSGTEVYPTFLYDDDRGGYGLVQLDQCPESYQGKDRDSTSRAAHDVSLLTATTSRVIDMEDTTVASGSLGTPSALEKSPLDFANENPPPLITERDGTEDQAPHNGNDEAYAMHRPRLLRRIMPASALHKYPRRKSLASNENRSGLHCLYTATQETPADAKSVSDPDLLSYVKPQPPRARRCPVFQENGHRDPHRKCCYHGGARQEFCGKSKVREIGLLPVHGRSQEVKLLKKATAKIARQDQRIQAREEEIKKLDQEIKSLQVVEAEVHNLQN